MNDSRSVTAKFTNDPFNTFFAIPTHAPDRDYAGVGAGLTALFKQGVSAFVNYETVLGLKDGVPARPGAAFLSRGPGCHQVVRGRVAVV